MKDKGRLAVVTIVPCANGGSIHIRQAFWADGKAANGGEGCINSEDNKTRNEVRGNLRKRLKHGWHEAPGLSDIAEDECYRLPSCRSLPSSLHSSSIFSPSPSPIKCKMARVA